MPNLPQIEDPAQDHAPRVVNENFVAGEHQVVYAKNYLFTTLLTWTYLGGRWGGFAITGGSLTLTASATNYIVVSIASGVASVSTSATNWNDATNYVRVYKVTTGTTTVSAIEDHRAGPRGVHGGAGGGGSSVTIDTDPTMAANSDTVVASQKAAKAYTDNKVAGLSWKQAVRAATTANGALATAYVNGSVIDGITIATGDRVLVKNQTTGSENGIYTVNASGAPTRATDADAGAELVNASVYISEGSTLADTQWTCSTNAPITPGTTALVFAQLTSGGGVSGLSTAVASNPATTFDAYGDSITTGTGSTTPATDGYIPHLVTDRALSVTNHAVSGDQIADQLKLVNALTVGDGQYSTLNIGLNDTRQYGSNASLKAAFKAAHMAALAWLAIPSAFKIKGQGGLTQSGTWATDGANGNIGLSSNTVSSTLTTTVYGTAVYVGYILNGTGTATFTVSIDGVSQGTFSCVPGSAVTTQNGQSYIGQLARFPNLSEGPHTVLITVASISGASVFIDWVGSNNPASSKVGPNVFTGNIYRLNTTGYAVAPANSSDAIIAAYNALIRQNVNALAADGLNVSLADTASRFLPGLHLASDGVHPNNAGHLIIENAYLDDMNQIGQPRLRNLRPIPDGGTAGQVLTKNSANDGDAAWVNPGPAVIPVVFQLAGSDRTTSLVVASDVANFRAPFAFTLTGVRASLDVASTSGLPTVNIKKNGTTVLSTNLSINATSKTSVGATTPAVISVPAIADDDEIVIDVTVAGTSAKGLIVTLIGTKP